MLTIVLSGPKSAKSQARNALARAGFLLCKIDPKHPTHGFPVEDGEPQEYIRVEGDDVDRAVAIASPLRYRVRAHWRPTDSLKVVEVATVTGGESVGS